MGGTGRRQRRRRRRQVQSAAFASLHDLSVGREREQRGEERRTRGEAMRSDGWRVETRDGGAEAETAAEQLKLTRRDGGTQLNQPNPVQYSTVQYVEVFDPIQSNAHANLHSA